VVHNSFAKVVNCSVNLLRLIWFYSKKEAALQKAKRRAVNACIPTLLRARDNALPHNYSAFILYMQVKIRQNGKKNGKVLEIGRKQ
jgi:hypothetical protein